MDKEQALQSFIESFYSNTELSRSAAAAMDQSGSSSVPLMITGEIGTGKDRVAYLHYAKSQFNDEPLYVVNCSMLNDKTWNFLINHYNSPFTDNGNTIYISNLGVLSHQRQKQLFHNRWNRQLKHSLHRRFSRIKNIGHFITLITKIFLTTHVMITDKIVNVHKIK